MRRAAPRWSIWKGLPLGALLLGALACQRPASTQAPAESSGPTPEKSATPAAPNASASNAAAANSASRISVAAAAGHTPVRITLDDQAMGTTVTLVTFTQPDVDETAARTALSSAVSEIRRLEALMSSWRPDTDIWRINNAKGQATQVSPETFEVLEKSVWAGQMSEGTFDITFEVMSDLWKFGDAKEADPKLPTAAKVAQRRKLVDYRALQLDAARRSVTLPADRRVGLGGIAKGYAVDKAAAVLRRAGLHAFLVQAGGDLLGEGRKPDGSPWVSGIQDPRGEKGNFFALIELENHAFSTAGDYARAYIKDGKRYHHIIDPRTGYPATAARSVTVWANDALTADAVDDAVFILGPEKGLKLVASLDGVGAVIVDASNKVWISDRIQGKVRITHEPTPGL